MDPGNELETFLRQAGFQLLEAAWENIFVTDTQGRIVFFNPAATETLGYGLPDLAGRNIGVLYRDQAVATEVMGHIRQTGRASVYEAVVLDQSGSEHIFSIKKAPLLGPTGRLLGFLSVSRDVTRERLHEEELRALKEFNEAILDSANDMITVTDTEGTITYFNPAAEKITGYRREEVLGRDVAMFYQDKELIRARNLEIGSASKAAEYEAIIVDKAGREHIFSISKAPLYDDDGILIGYAATSRDITERRRREEELRRLKEFNDAVLASVTDLVVVTDLEGRITYYNPSAERTTGFSFADIKGRRISELYKDETFADQKLDYIRSTGEANSYEATVLSRDGRIVILEVNKAPLHDATGALIGFAAVSRDVTRRRQAEERVRELTEMVAENSPLRIESQLMRTRVAEIMNSEIIPLTPDQTLATAGARLIREDLPGLPVVGPVQEVIGLITFKDLATQGLFHGTDQNAAVGGVMRIETPTIAPDAYYFDALMAMVQGRTQVLPVTEGRHLRGLITMNDLMRSRGASIMEVLEGIGNRTDIEGLAGLRAQVDRILISLVTDGAPAAQVTGIITEFNDRITRRLLAICQEEMGPAPADWAWLGLGSEGRREQTLTTDQDNALIFGDLAGPDQEARAYFARLAEKAVVGLARCGFALCPGLIMANQPRWSGSSSEWLNRIRLWVTEATPQRTRDAMTFLDFRGLFGRIELATDLRTRTNRLFAENHNFLTAMAEDTLSKAPPLGLFKRFLVEKTGPHKGQVNLKTIGTLVIIDCLRLLAVKEGLSATNTLDRLEALSGQGLLSADQAASIREAYQTLMGLRLWVGIQAHRDGRTESSHLDPDLLPKWQRQRLREAFLVAEDLQKIVRQQFWWVG